LLILFILEHLCRNDELRAHILIKIFCKFEVVILLKPVVITGVLAAVIVSSWLVFSGSSEISEASISPSEEPASIPSLAVASVVGMGIVNVIGPCHEGTKGNDVFPLRSAALSDCYFMTSDGRDLLDASKFDGPVFVKVSSGFDSIVLGDGDDVIEVRGNFNVIVDAGTGFNVMSFPGLDIPDVSLRVEGEDILVEGKRGSLRMRRQFPREGVAAPIQRIVFDDGSLEAGEIYLRAIDGQATDGDDVLTGTPQNDIIYPGLGNDRISALEGDDAIFYEGGNDVIMGSFEGVGFDTLSLPYSSSQVTFAAVNNRDVIITTPSGSVTLQFQIFFPVGDARSNIDQFIFKDGVFSDGEVRRVFLGR
jgi:hypothetical protein